MSFYRGTGDVDSGAVAGTVLFSQNNLSDVDDAATSRTNLGISAANTPFSATGAIASTDVQAAIAEVASESAQLTTLSASSGSSLVGDNTGGGLWSTVKGFITYLLSSSGSSIVGFTPTGNISSTNVQAAIAEEVSDLSASSGSSLIGFIQSGTGAVATTAQSELRSKFRAEQFGAVGDGSTNDRVSIQKAIDAVYAAGGGSVELGPHTYVIDMQPDPTRLTIKAGVKLFGQGAATVIKCTGTVNTVGLPYFIWMEGTASELCHLTLDVNSTNLTFQDTVGVSSYGGICVGADTPVVPAPKAKVHDLIIKNCSLGPVNAHSNQASGLGITLFNCPYAIVENITFDTCNSGLYSSRDVIGTVTKYRINNIAGINMTYGVVHFEFGDGDVATNIVCVANSSYTQAVSSSPQVGETGIFFNTMYNLELTNVTCYGGKLWNRISDAGVIDNCSISNVTCQDNLGSSVGLGVDLSNMVDAKLVNVSALGCAGGGFYLHGKASLTNCLARLNLGQGFNLTAATSKFSLINCKSENNNYHGYTVSVPASLINCEALNNSQGSSGTYDGLRINIDGVFVTGGSYYDDQGGSATQKYGVYEQITTASNRFLGISVLTGNITSGLVSNGNASVVYNCAGYNAASAVASVITVTASPFTYTAGPTMESISMYGGTVSQVDDGTQALAIASPATFVISPHTSLHVTYTVAPTMKKYIH